MKGNGNCYFRAISFISQVLTKSPGCKGQIELFGIWKVLQLERNLMTISTKPPSITRRAANGV